MEAPETTEAAELGSAASVSRCCGQYLLLAAMVAVHRRRRRTGRLAAGMGHTGLCALWARRAILIRIRIHRIRVQYTSTNAVGSVRIDVLGDNDRLSAALGGGGGARPSAIACVTSTGAGILGQRRGRKADGKGRSCEDFHEMVCLHFFANHRIAAEPSSAASDSAVGEIPATYLPQWLSFTVGDTVPGDFWLASGIAPCGLAGQF